MRIYTSYYYQIRNFPPNLIALSTAIWPPKYITFGEKDARGVICVDCPPFKPGHSCSGLCNGKCNPKHPNNCEFLKAYKAQLDKLNIHSIQESLGKLATQIARDEGLQDIDFAFLVYETPTNSCSERAAIQQYFKEHGIECKEWNPNI